MTLFPTISAQHWRDHFRRWRANPSNTVAERIRQRLMTTPIIETKATESGPSVPGPDTLAELYRVMHELGSNRVSVAIDSDFTGEPKVFYSVWLGSKSFCGHLLSDAVKQAQDWRADTAAVRNERIKALRSELADLENV